MSCCALQNIPERVFVALDCLLADSHDQVRRAAAITLYALEHPTEKVRHACGILFVGLAVRLAWKLFCNRWQQLGAASVASRVHCI